MKRGKPLMCFDLDGTIIDSTEAHLLSYKTAFEKNNLKPPRKEKLIKEFGQGTEKIIQKIYPRISGRKLKKVVEDHVSAHAKYCSLIKQVPHVREALLKLKKHFKLGIITNSCHEEALELLECAKIPTKIFDVILGEDDAKPKPSPSEILLAEKLTKSDAKYMVGDTIFDIKAGKRAGCRTIGVLSGIHTMEQLMSASPDILASSVAILPEILLNK